MRNHACRMRRSVRTRLLRDRTAARRPGRPRQDAVVLCVLGPSRNCSSGATRHLGDRETVSRVFADRIARLRDRALIGVSDWQARDRRTLKAVVGVVIAWRDRDDTVTVLAKPYVVIPAAMRRHCRWRPGVVLSLRG